jgi:hypothetical protein
MGLQRHYQAAAYFTPEQAVQLKAFAESKKLTISKVLSECFLEVCQREQDNKKEEVA